MNAIDRILEEMLEDDEDRDDQSNKLELVYNEASESERTKLDDAFICICGWSLLTVIRWKN